MTQITEEENFQYSQNLFKFSIKPKDNYKSQFLPHHFNSTIDQNKFPKQNYSQNNMYNANSMTGQFVPRQQTNQPNFQNQSFPRGPINIQPREIQNKIYPTNRQVFGLPKNVFQPTGKVPLNKPEPMSNIFQSTLPYQNIQTNQSNHFKSHGPRNFISKELFQIDFENGTPQADTTNNKNFTNTPESDNNLPNCENSYSFEQFENFEPPYEDICTENPYNFTSNNIDPENDIDFQNSPNFPIAGLPPNGI